MSKHFYTERKPFQIVFRIFLMVLFMFPLPAISQVDSYTWLWARQMGGYGWDIGGDAACDLHGNVYVSGSFPDSMMVGSQSFVSKGGRDIFLSCIDAQGRYTWGVQTGGKGDDFAGVLKVSPKGDIYVTGTTQVDDAAGGTLTGHAMVVTSYSSLGAMQWQRVFRGRVGNRIEAMICTADSQVWIAGRFEGELVLGEQTTLTSDGRTDVFVVRLNLKGDVVWSMAFGGRGYDTGTALCAGTKGQVLLCGSYEQRVSLGHQSVNVRFAGNTGVFLACLDSKGNVQWAREITESRGALGKALATDRSGNIYVGGNFSTEAWLNNERVHTRGSQDIFLSVTGDDGHLKWTRTLGGSMYDCLINMAMDEDNRLVAGGTFSDTLVVGDTILSSLGELSDVFAVTYDTLGEVLWAGKAGGRFEDYPRAMAQDGTGNVYFMGSFRGEMEVRQSELRSAGREDIFVMKLYNCPRREVFIRGDSVLCENSTLLLDAGRGYKNYVWNEGLFRGRLAEIKRADTYTVVTTDSLGCNNQGTRNIISRPVPPVQLGSDQTIWNYQNVSLTNKAGSVGRYLWNDTEFGEVYTFSGNRPEGDYRVVLTLTDSYGCSNSDTVVITVKAGAFAPDAELMRSTIDVFPIPAKQEVYFVITDACFENLSVSLTSASGTPVLIRDFPHYVQGTRAEISLDAIPAGLYVMHLRAGSYERAQTIVHQ